ncbi:MAG: electron transfer flavoprotein subunit alpha/FixB family protein [Dehalococcoidales bacterium]|nr:electron transfer flavoprotein subunit alpha/FixB family protein [Dehalococcoidales bacterium]
MIKDKEIWVFAEQRDGHLARVTFELLGKACELSKKLNAKVASILAGNDVASLTGELAAYGTERTYLIEDARLRHYQSEAYAANITALVKQYEPEIFLLGSTDTGRDLAPRVAAKIGTGLTAHCVNLEIEAHEGVLILNQIVPGWGGNKSIKIICPQKRPQMATVKPGVFDLPLKKETGNTEIIRFPARLSEKYFRAETIEAHTERATSQPIEEAEVVIAVGWGAYSLGNLDLVKELAGVLGGVIGGTRPMVDKGWVSETNMIGQSGKIINPKLFISLGASGAMHFTTGFERAKFVLAVDENPEAPIFKTADIGIAGDLRNILPCLIDEFKKLKQETDK